MIGTGQVRKGFRPYLLAVAVVAFGAALMLSLTGCTKPLEPVYVTTTLPEIPVECSVVCPAEPRLPEDDIDDATAAADRSRFKRAYRCERHARATCTARLKVLLPQEVVR